jgi:PAS domain S-box-containing protein
MLGLLVATVGLAAFATTRLYDTSENRYVKEAFPLRGSSRDLLLQMVNEETGVRGYLITGDRSSLAPYDTAKRLVAADLLRLEQLSGRRPEIATEVAELRALVPQLQRYFARQIALVASGGAGQVRAQDDVLVGKARFDRFRQIATRILVHSEQIVQSAERSQRHTYWSTIVIVLGLGAAAAAIGMALLLSLPQRMEVLYRREGDARRAAERGDRASRALAHVDAAVVLLDRTDVIRYWNPAAATSLGVSEHLALGHPAREIVPELAAVEQALARGGQDAIVPLTRQGSERWFAASETGFPEGRVIVLRDVTAEQQLDRARTEFLATASHELRTPLTAVYGAVRTLRRFDRPDDPQLTERLLEMIEQESERLSAIVDQILVSAQLDRHALHLDQRACDLRELSESVIASAAVRFEDRVIALDAPEDVVVDCDPARLRQVLVNLVDNALKYSARDGRVDVRVRRLVDAVELEVEDEGIGIPPDGLPHVFEKFYRADPDMLGGVGGSGLGLYISRELAEQMGGSITVRSTLGRGSTFTLRLPLGLVRPASLRR